MSLCQHTGDDNVFTGTTQFSVYVFIENEHCAFEFLTLPTSIYYPHASRYFLVTLIKLMKFYVVTLLIVIIKMYLELYQILQTDLKPMAYSNHVQFPTSGYYVSHVYTYISKRTACHKPDSEINETHRLREIRDYKSKLLDTSCGRCYGWLFCTSSNDWLLSRVLYSILVTWYLYTEKGPVICNDLRAVSI